MPDPLVLHQIVGSPNNKKVRIALHYKELPFTSEPLDVSSFPIDRSRLIELSRQPLSPVIQHGDRVLFGSGAILRYLEANFPGTKPLFSTDEARMRRIEEVEHYASARLQPPVGKVFTAIFAAGGRSPEEVGEEASREMHEATARIEEAVSDSEFLLGGDLTAADVFCAPFVALSMLRREETQTPIASTFHDVLHLGAGREHTRKWVERVMAYAN